MPTITVTKEQVVELVKQLPPTERRLALFTLAQEAFTQPKAPMVYAVGCWHQRISVFNYKIISRE